MRSIVAFCSLLAVSLAHAGTSVRPNVLVYHVMIEGGRNSCILNGLPESIIKNINLRDVAITAGRHVSIRNAEGPLCERVTLKIKPGVDPPHTPWWVK